MLIEMFVPGGMTAFVPTYILFALVGTTGLLFFFLADPSTGTFKTLRLRRLPDDGGDGSSLVEVVRIRPLFGLRKCEMLGGREPSKYVDAGVAHYDGATAAPALDHFTTLPQEIFDQIVGYARGPKPRKARVHTGLYASLRLINRRACAKTEKWFSKHHFTSLYILLCDDESLIRAEKIASHPIWGKTTRNFIINVDEVDQRQDVVAPLQQIRGHPSTGSSVLRSDQLYEKQQRLRHTGQDLRLLTSMFSHAQARGKTVLIQLRDHLCTEYVWPSRSMWRKYAYLDNPWTSSRSVFLTPKPVNQQPWELIMAAVALSRVEVHRFETATKSWSVSTDSFQGPTMAASFRGMLARAMTHMKLAIWTPVPSKGGSISAFVEALVSCQTLATLTLSFCHPDVDNLDMVKHYRRDRGESSEPDSGQYPGGHLVMQELLKQKFTALSRLLLEHAALYLQDLQIFIASNPKVKYISIQNGKLGGCEQWCRAGAVTGSDISRWLTGHFGIEVRCQPHSNHWEQQDWSKVSESGGAGKAVRNWLPIIRLSTPCEAIASRSDL